MATAQQEVKKTSTEVKPEEKVLLLHVSEIHADYAWNARSGEWWKDAETEGQDEPGGKKENGAAADAPTAPKKQKKAPKVDERTKFADLKSSILETGTNEQPILARQPAKAGGKIRLVCGFMRYRAVTELSQAAKDQGPAEAQRGLIRVVIRDMTDQQARMSNIRENTSRDDLRGPDLCWSVGEAIKQYGFSDTTLAASLGKSQGYVSKLHRIYDRLSQKALEKWRYSPIPITIDQIQSEVIMMVGKNADPDNIPSEEEQLDYLNRVLAAKASGPIGRGPDGWVETKTKEARELGELLGLLQGSDIIKVVEGDPRITVFTVVDLPARYKKMEPKKQAKTEKAILAAFSAGVETGLLKAQEEPEENEDDEEDDVDVDELDE